MSSGDINQDRILSNTTLGVADLKNRGPLDFEIKNEILDSYWKHGFYILENVIDPVEIRDLREEFADLLQRTPSGSKSFVDAKNRRVKFDEIERQLFRFVKPLSDPYGGTAATGGRYQVKLSEPCPPVDAPTEVLLQIGGILQFLDSCLRIYGHPNLLALAAAINGEDFTPFNEVIWLKQPRLGAAVSWHQDGTTHWSSPTLDQGTHGFNFMLNLYKTSPENALWVVPGTHKQGKVNIRDLASNGNSEFLDGAVPLLCNPGDVAIVNRQIVHGSLPNQSDIPRYTFVFGFHRRSSLEGVQGWGKEPYTAEFIDNSSQIIPLAIAARSVKNLNERSFQYQPFTDKQPLDWNETNREKILHHYHKRMLGI